MTVNIVPTPTTKRLARIMLAEAQETSGFDATLRNLTKMEKGQGPALVALLLNTIAPRTTGRPRVPVTLTDEQRKSGYSQYRMGVRNEFTELAMREYQRLNKRHLREIERARRRADQGRVSP